MKKAWPPWSAYAGACAIAALWAGIALAGTKSFQGTITAVDAEQRTITVKSGGDEEKTFTLSRSAKITIGKKSGKLDALEADQRVLVIYNPDDDKASAVRVLDGAGSASGTKSSKPKKATADGEKEEGDSTASADPRRAKKRLAESGPPQVNKLAPEISGKDLDGKVFKLSDYLGKVIVIDFWGDW